MLSVTVGVLGYPAAASLAQQIGRLSRGDPCLNRPANVNNGFYVRSVLVHTGSWQEFVLATYGGKMTKFSITGSSS